MLIESRTMTVRLLRVLSELYLARSALKVHFGTRSGPNRLRQTRQRFTAGLTHRSNGSWHFGS